MLWKPFTYAYAAGKLIFLYLLLLATLISLVLFLFFCPFAIIAETIALFQMDTQTSGIVTDISIDHSAEGSAARVTYQFVWNGVQIESQRMFPGFAGDLGTYSGGSLLARGFQVGQPCTVYFDTSLPSRCALQYGWFKWSIGFTAGLWGTLLVRYFEDRKSIYTILWTTVQWYGFGLLLLGPIAVKVSEIHWHCLAFAAILFVVSLVHLLKRNALAEGIFAKFRSPAV